jgi:hypothetical protein
MISKIKLLIQKYPKMLGYTIGYVNGITSGIPVGGFIYYKMN